VDNSRFSSLIYRIIGKPDRWHSDYIDQMHQALNETEKIDDPQNFSELQIGDQILNQTINSNETLMAFGALLDNSRFKMIILDDTFSVIYLNKNAQTLYAQIRETKNKDKLKIALLNKVKSAAAQNQKLFSEGDHSGICAIDYIDQNKQQLYLRTIHNQHELNGQRTTFYLLLVADQAATAKELNPDLVDRYEFTDKEQSVLIKLTHGHTIKQIATSSFVSENTVKTHLKALFRKTNTKSQADIVRLVLTDESQVIDTYFGAAEGVLDSLPVKLANDKFVTLNSNDLTIAYREYGPADGHPIIVCHNGYGCRVTIPNGYEEICQRQNKRIIIPDRPGYGLTPFQTGHPENWNTYLTEFIDILGLESYDLLGSVLGSVIALNFAVQADHRLKRLRLSSPVFVNTRKDTEYLTGIFSPATRLAQASKRLAREVYQLWLKSVTINLSLHYRNMLKNGLGSVERELFSNDKTIDLMVDGFRQACCEGLDGISYEMVYCISPRNIDLSNINVPVDLWWGTEDNRISHEGVKNLAGQLKNARLHVREGYSEYIYYALFEDIIA